MKQSKSPSKRATWREYTQGGLVGSLLAVSFYAAASTCMQIDSVPKVADYYDQYRDYRDQFNELKKWQERVDPGALLSILPEGLQSAASQIEGRYKEADRLYGELYEGLELVQGEFASAAMSQIGSLSRPDWSNGVTAPDNSLQLCRQLDMGAGIGWVAKTGKDNDFSRRCGTEGYQKLADKTVRPSRAGSGVAPNTAQAADVTRAVMSNEFSMLDVVRGDLAWLRDNPEYQKPFRYPRETLEIPIEETARRSSSLQRVGAIMAGRGFAANDYHILKPGKDTLAEEEAAYQSATLLGHLNLAYDGMARYATAYPRIAAMRDALLDVDADTIDSANEAERYGIGLHLQTMEGEASALRSESRQIDERLMGVLLSGKLSGEAGDLMGDRL